MKEKVVHALQEAISKLGLDVKVELTLAKGHADFATNAPMKIARTLNDTPLNVAAEIAKRLQADFIASVEVAPPGFINIFLKKDVLAAQVAKIIDLKENFGRGQQAKYINVEYVSANPTGHLHLGHARNAAIGSTLVNVLRFAGNRVDAEYYVNDAGNQIDILGISVWTRYQNLFGANLDLPNDSYRGHDIVDCALHLQNHVFGERYKGVAYEQTKDIFKLEAQKYMLAIIKEHLMEYRVVFDVYSSERAIYESGQIPLALAKLKNYSYEHEKALWLRTTARGDDKDRVMVKSDKTYTYLTPDIAYHDMKLIRGYDELINVWGADHVGYIKRMAIALEFLGLPNDRLDILTVQLVKLVKDGVELKMSKRKGTSYTLQELLEEVNVDACRWFMIDRSNNSEFVFDVNQARSKSSDNPVFTVQYTHARAHQLIGKSTKQAKASMYENNEIELINLLGQFPELIIAIANSHKVHLLPQYLLEVSKSFNFWYSNSKLLGHLREQSLLALVEATKIVIANGLNLMGINAPDYM